MAPGRPYIGREPFHQSSLFLFYQNKNFDVKVNSIADENTIVYLNLKSEEEKNEIGMKLNIKQSMIKEKR